MENLPIRVVVQDPNDVKALADVLHLDALAMGGKILRLQGWLEISEGAGSSPAATCDAHATHGEVIQRLAGRFRFSRRRATEIVQSLGMTMEDLTAWEAWSRGKPRAEVLSMIQTFKHPSQVPTEARLVSAQSVKAPEPELAPGEYVLSREDIQKRAREVAATLRPSPAKPEGR